MKEIKSTILNAIAKLCIKHADPTAELFYLLLFKFSNVDIDFYVQQVKARREKLKNSA